MTREPASALQARVLAALATWRMLLGEPGEALPLAMRAVPMAEQVGADASTHMAWPRWASSRPSAASWRPGWRRSTPRFALACRTGDIEDIVRAATNRMYLLYTAGRFAEALDMARDGRQAARSLGAPPALTSVLDNNTAAVLIATGRWAEADQLLAELIGESAANVTRYLQLLPAGTGRRPGRDGSARRNWPAALRDSPEDPRLLGPLHACLAEQALNAGDLVTAADEVLHGLAALKGAALAE